MRLSAEAPEGETFDIENDCEAAGPKFSGIKPPGHNFFCPLSCGQSDILRSGLQHHRERDGF